MIAAETLAEIRHDQPDIRIVQWNIDPLFEPDNIGRIESKLDVVDVTLISTAGDKLRNFVRPGGIVGFMPNPVDFSIERGSSHEQDELPFDLFYACGNPAKPLRHVFGIDWNMNDFITALHDLSPKLRACLPGIKGAPHLDAAAYQAALEQSAIGLNISRRQDFPLYSSDRMAHLAGNGLAVCMEHGSGFEDLFSDKEILFSSTLQELADQINELRASPHLRQEIATAGRARYAALFNERKIARYIADVTFDRLDHSTYEWPTTL
ncbi:MAG: glycosyltransferase family protein [Rhizomicrobium sp.]